MSILSASTLSGDKVVNRDGESLGDIKDLMIDTETGRVTYAVLEFGGFLGMGSKLFAVPLAAMTVDASNQHFILNQSRESLETAPGFNKDNWPDFADRSWATDIHTHYGVTPYWHGLPPGQSPASSRSQP